MDGSVVLFDEDDKDDTDFNEIVKRNLLSDLDSTLKVEKEYVKVYLRIRPFTKDEQQKNENQRCVEIEDDRSVVAQAPKDSHTHRSTAYGLAKHVQKFKFSKVFGDNTSQKAFFDETMLTTVREFIDGENCLVFTYGVTNSGKTYTIQGEPKDGGLLPRSLDVVFNSVHNRLYSRMDLKPNMHSDVQRLTLEQEQAEVALKESILKMTFIDEKDVSAASNSSESLHAMSEDSLNPSQDHNGDIDGLADEISTVVANRKREEATIEVKSQGQIRFSIWVSFVEIYNEQMFDLLVPVSKKKFDRRPILLLRDDKNGNPYVKDLRQINVSSADEAYRLLALGKRNLKIACTKLNQSSSRSHCIFTIKMIRVVDTDKPHYARVSVLSLCDLAGSERHQKTDNVGDRLKEAGNINSSLLTLGRCITALRANQNSKHTDRAQIVPFRDSKLTRLFQTYLTGKGRASMIVNINQCASMFDETLNSLRYSAIAKQVVVRESLPKPGIFDLSKRQDSFQPPKQNTTLDRGTVGWASPGAYKKMIEEGELSVCGTFHATKEEEYDENDETVHEDEEEQGTMTEIDTSQLEEDETELTKEREMMLLDVIRQLKEKLQSEVNAKDALEMKIRAEVCEEMKKQLVIIDNQYQENLRVREEINDEKLEKKMEIYKEAMQKSKKRRLENDDEEYVPKHLLQAENAEVVRCKNRIEELQDELKASKEEIIKLKSNFTVVSKERESLTQEMTKAQFFASDVRQKLDDVQSKLNESSCLTVDLGEQIRSLTEECESQKLTVFQSAEMIKDLELMNKSLLDKLEERDGLLEKLKSELAGREENLAVAKEQTKNEDKQQHNELFPVNSEIEEIKQQLVKVKQESDDLITERNLTIDRLTQEKEQAERLAVDFKIQIAELKKDLSNSKHETLVVVQKLNSAREERDRLARVNEEANQLASELRTQTTELRTELTSSQETVVALEAKVQVILSERNSLGNTTEEIEGLNSDLKSQITRAEAELTLCRSDLAFTEKQLESVSDERDALSLEQQKLTCLLSDQKAQISELSSKLSCYQDSMAEAEMKLVADSEKQIQSVAEERDSLAEEKKQMTRLLSEQEIQIEELKSELSCHQDSLAEAEKKLMADAEKQMESVAEERDSLAKEKKQMTRLLSEQEMQIEELKSELSCCQNSLADAEKRLDSVTEERNNLAEEKKQMTRLLSEQEIQIEELKSELSCHQDSSLAEAEKKLMADAEKQMESVAEERDSLAKEKKQMTRLLSEQEMHIEELKSELCCCQNSLADAEKRLDSVTEERKNLVEEKQQMSKLLSEREMQVEELKSKLTNYESQVNELEERCVTLSLEVECLLKKKQELSETEEHGKQDISLNESCNVAELKAQNEYLEVTLEKVKLDLSKCSKERDHLEEESTRAQFLSSGAKLKLEQMQNRLDEKNEVITDLHSKLRDLNSDYELQKSVADRSAADMARLEAEVAGLIEQLSRQKRSDSGYPETLEKKIQVLEHKLMTSQETERELKEKLKSSTHQLHVSEATVAELKSHLKTKSDGVRKLSQTPSIRRSRLNGQQIGFGSDEADDEADGFRMEFENMRNLDPGSACRSQTRSSHSKSRQMKQVENLDPLNEPDEEENIITPQQRVRKTPAASNKHLSGNFSGGSNLEKIPSMKSPQKSPTIPKRRRKLLSTVDEQLVATPCAQEERDFVEPSPHTSVIRRLRSRKN